MSAHFAWTVYHSQSQSALISRVTLEKEEISMLLYTSCAYAVLQSCEWQSPLTATLS